MHKIIIFPTDTVYGIGTHYLNQTGIKKIYDIKGRDFNKPISILVSSIEAAHQIGKLNDHALKTVQTYWPGGLTIVVPTTDAYFKQSGEKTIGLRMPNHQLALKILKTYGPLKTTSVNKSHEAPLNDYETIYKNYHHLVDEIYKNDEPLSEVSSTVVAFTHDLPSLIRKGDVSLEDIMKVLEK